MLSQPARQIPPFPPFSFLGFFLLLRAGFSLIYWSSFSWDFSFFLKNWITSCLFQFAFLLPLTPYQSGIKTLQCIISSSFLGPFQIFLFLLWSLFPPFYKLCDIPAFHLHNFSWTPGFMALLLLLGPYLKLTLEKSFEKHQVPSIGSFLLWTLWERKKNFVIKRGCSSVCHFYVNSVFTIPQCSAFSFAWNLKGIFFFFFLS